MAISFNKGKKSKIGPIKRATIYVMDRVVWFAGLPFRGFLHGNQAPRGSQIDDDLGR